MKQAQSHRSRYRSPRTWQAGGSNAPRGWHRTDRPPAASTVELQQSSSWSFGQLFLGMLAAIWFIVTLPFRLIFWMIAWAGRLTVAVLGFSLMVVGIALWAGPFFFIGIPLFLIGVVLTLRCLD